MQEDLRGAESQYADLPGFESQRGNQVRHRWGASTTHQYRQGRYAPGDGNPSAPDISQKPNASLTGK